MKILKILSILAVLSFISACSSTSIKNIDEYTVKPMLKSDVLPTESELKSRPYNVAVFEIEDEAVELAKNSDVGASIAGEVSKFVNKSNARTVASDAGLLTAINSNQKTYPASNIDYAIVGQVSVANYKKVFTPSSTYKDKNGKIHIVEPSCDHSALVQGRLDFYNVKDMSLMNTLDISGGANQSLRLKVNQASYCRQLSSEEIRGLVRSAGTKAARREDVNIENVFSPKGYVLERRTNGEKSIIKISLGQNNGVEESQKAEIFSVVQNKNPITNKMDLVQNKIAEGKVSDKVFRNYAWIIMDDEQASSIKVGDVVKLSFEKGMLDKIFNHSFN